MSYSPNLLNCSFPFSLDQYWSHKWLLKLYTVLNSEQNVNCHLWSTIPRTMCHPPLTVTIPSPYSNNNGQTTPDKNTNILAAYIDVPWTCIGHWYLCSVISICLLSGCHSINCKYQMEMTSNWIAHILTHLLQLLCRLTWVRLKKLYSGSLLNVAYLFGW